MKLRSLLVAAASQPVCPAARLPNRNSHLSGPDRPGKKKIPADVPFADQMSSHGNKAIVEPSLHRVSWLVRSATNLVGGSELPLAWRISGSSVSCGASNV